MFFYLQSLAIPRSLTFEVPRANGPEDLDMSNYEHFKETLTYVDADFVPFGGLPGGYAVMPNIGAPKIQK